MLAPLIAAQIRTEGGSFLSASVYFLSMRKPGGYRAEARIESLGSWNPARRLGAFVDADIRRRMKAAVGIFPAHPPREWTLFFDTRTTSWDSNIVSSLTTIRLNEARETAFGAAYGPKGRLRFRDLLRAGTDPVQSFRAASGNAPLGTQDEFFATKAGVTWIVNGGSKPRYLKAKWADIPGALPTYHGRIMPGEPLARLPAMAEIEDFDERDWMAGQFYVSLLRRRNDGGLALIDRCPVGHGTHPYWFDFLFRLPKLETGESLVVVATLQVDGKTKHRSDPLPIASPGWSKQRHIVLRPVS